MHHSSMGPPPRLFLPGRVRRLLLRRTVENLRDIRDSAAPLVACGCCALPHAHEEPQLCLCVLPQIPQPLVRHLLAARSRQHDERLGLDQYPRLLYAHVDTARSRHRFNVHSRRTRTAPQASFSMQRELESDEDATVRPLHATHLYSFSWTVPSATSRKMRTWAAMADAQPARHQPCYPHSSPHP